MLAVLKAGAAYVPLDPGVPGRPHRLHRRRTPRRRPCCRCRTCAGTWREVQAEVVAVDDLAAAHRRAEPCPADRGRARAGARRAGLHHLHLRLHGRPKGVAVEHRSIVNFVRVAAEVYGIPAGRPVYQGMTIAFDFSVEEIWVPWAVGATLVPKPAGRQPARRRPARRSSPSSGSPRCAACRRCWRPSRRTCPRCGSCSCPARPARTTSSCAGTGRGRRFLNVYGPTEATVSATWAVVDPDRPVTIGVPLPTYSTVILDPDDPGRALPHGEVGEIGHRRDRAGRRATSTATT